MISVLFSSTFMSDRNSVFTTTPNTVIEVVLFEANPSYSAQQVKEVMTALNDLIKLFPGFIERTTATASEGKYIDIVYWVDIESAKNAADDIMKNPEAQEFFKVINFETIQILHFNSFNQLKE